MITARKENWKINPFPSEFTTLNLDMEVSPEEYEMIKRGLIPAQMEDKWFIYVENGWLYFHRSWSGNCIYVVKIEEKESYVLLTTSFVNRMDDQYSETDDLFDQDLLKFLINRLLLAKDVPFPSRQNDDEKKRVY
ncbi:MAG: hypothetical protein KDC90_17960 [Ignavibacteriae bacterium]|nr:hypothetical protein [Ignavibacteriota bacterium]